MPKIVIEKEGLSLDEVVWLATGDPDTRLVEATRAINKGLSFQPTILPLGLAIDLPEITSTPATVSVVRLWD